MILRKVRGMSVIRILSAFGCAFLCANSTLAYTESCNREMQAQCAQVLPGEGRMTNCILRSRPSYSPACVVEVNAVIEQRFHFLQKCKESIQKFCANVKPVNGRLYSCIQINNQDIPEICKQELFNG